MDTESKTIAQETFDSLPKDIQETIFSDDYQAFLTDVATRYALTKEQGSELEFQVTMVLIGQANQGYLPFNLEAELGIDEETAQKISTEIEENVFSVVTNSLEQLEKDALGTEEDLDNILDREETLTPTPLQETEISQTSDTAIISPTSTEAEVLTSLTTRLTQPSVITPAIRDHSIVNSHEEKNSAPQKTFDPYRELPEK